MTAAKHTSPRDRSFRRSLLRNAAGGVGLVVLVAAIFGVLGMIGRDDPTLDIADGPEEPEEDVATEGAPVEEPAETPPEGPVEAPAEEEPEEPADEGPEEPAEEEPAEEEPAEEPEEEPSPPAIDPAEISVQVLDGYREDGGAAADAVFEQLEAAGYRIIARNPAIAYEVTTVLWTAGYEAEGRQVAEEIGAPEAREQPGNLSTSVNVHVVVGADRG